MSNGKVFIIATKDNIIILYNMYKAKSHILLYGKQISVGGVARFGGAKFCKTVL